MSLRQNREAIAAALSTVDGVTGHEKRPVPPAEGDAWPMLAPGERAAGTAFQVTWVVRVLVPQDEIAAADWWDLHWPSLFYALQPIGHVTRFAPGVMSSSGIDQLVYEITMQTEE